MGSKFDIEKFTGTNDFGLWKVKMRVVLVHNKCVEALKGAQMPASLSDAEKADLNERAVSAITTRKVESGGISKKELASVQTVATCLVWRLDKRRKMRRR
jgi:hypothetical protein